MTPRPSLWLLALAVGIAAPAAPGQAFCSLKDPTSQIHAMYPASENYRSIVGTVGTAARDAVKRRLPFEHHFNEFGRHTLYLALDEGRPTGFVHSRSEATDWGLVEVVWALDVDLKLTGFAFQRCRSPLKSELETPAFLEVLRGRDFDALRSLLSEDGSAPRGPLADFPAALAVPVVRCGLKTIAVTEAAWGHDIVEARLTVAGPDSFPGAVFSERLTPFGSSELQRTLTDPLLADASALDISELVAVRFKDVDGTPLGLLVQAPWRMVEPTLPLRFSVDARGTLTAVTSERGWPSPAVRQEVESMVGLHVDDVESCHTATQLTAAHVLAIWEASASSP